MIGMRDINVEVRAHTNKFAVCPRSISRALMP